MIASPSTAEAPIVVVGAGPVGLTAALGFAAHGVPTVVLESGTVDVSPEWRGSTIHPPTLEVLDELGVADDALAGGVRVDTIQYRDLQLDDNVEMHYGVLAGRTRFPFRLQYDQYKLLRALRDAAAAAADVDVRYEHAVTGVEPGDEPGRAAIVLRASDGSSRRIGGRWIVAADGSHSTVRRSVGVSMTGDTYPTMSLVVATGFAFDRSIAGLAPVSYWTGPRGRMSLIRTPDTWRVAITTGDPRSGGDATDAGAAPVVSAEFLEAMAQLVGEREWADVRQHQYYRSHQRVADSFHIGRVLLIGDAAHLSSTTGGMGLNSGVHDAHELVRALAPAVLAGRGEAAAAVSATTHRRDIAIQLVQPATRAAREQLDLTEEAARRSRLKSLRQIAADEERMTAHLVTASMLDAVDLGRVRSGAKPTDNNRCR